MDNTLCQGGVVALVKLCAFGDVEEGVPVPVTVDNLPELGVYKLNGMIFVADNRCTHGLANLTDGFQEGKIIECPFHGGSFDLTTGEPSSAPCQIPIKTYAAKVMDGFIYIDVS